MATTDEDSGDDADPPDADIPAQMAVNRRAAWWLLVPGLALVGAGLLIGKTKFALPGLSNGTLMLAPIAVALVLIGMARRKMVCPACGGFVGGATKICSHCGVTLVASVVRAAPSEAELDEANSRFAANMRVLDRSLTCYRFAKYLLVALSLAVAVYMPLNGHPLWSAAVVGGLVFVLGWYFLLHLLWRIVWGILWMLYAKCPLCGQHFATDHQMILPGHVASHYAIPDFCSGCGARMTAVPDEDLS